MDKALPKDAVSRKMIAAMHAEKEEKDKESRRQYAKEWAAQLTGFGGDIIFAEEFKKRFDYAMAARLIIAHLRKADGLFLYACPGDNIRGFRIVSDELNELPPEELHTRITVAMRILWDFYNEGERKSLLQRNIEELKAWMRQQLERLDYDEIFSQKYIWFRNGIFDFEANQFQPISYTEEGLTRKPFLVLPWCYYEGFAAEKDLEIEKFFEMVIPDQSEREYFFNAVSHALLPCLPSQTIFLVGGGANGKSVILEILQKAFGLGNVSCITFSNITASRFGTRQLVGKLCNTASEEMTSEVLDSALFRAVATRERVSVEDKYEKPFAYRPHASLVFAMNAMPEIGDAGFAFYRRIHIIHCPRMFVAAEDADNKEKFPANPKIAQKFEDYDYTYFLNKLLRHAIMQYEKPAVPSLKEIREQEDRHEFFSNTAAVFVRERLLTEDDRRIERKAIFESYRKFCLAKQFPVMGKKKFYKHLEEEEKLELVTIMGVRYFAGVKLKQEGSEITHGVK